MTFTEQEHEAARHRALTDQALAGLAAARNDHAAGRDDEAAIARGFADGLAAELGPGAAAAAGRALVSASVRVTGDAFRRLGPGRAPCPAALGVLQVIARTGELLAHQDQGGQP